jgi:hypothetical protein
MARKQDWQREVEDARRRDEWSLTPPTRLIKVVPVEAPVMKAVRGYVTVEKSIIGRTPRQLEDALGLPAGLFNRGCRVYRLTRLPHAHEIEYELTLDQPDGLPFDEWAALDNALRGRLAMDGRLGPYRPAKPIYRPGSRSIHQWQLTAALPAAVVIELLPNVTYPYPRA